MEENKVKIIAYYISQTGDVQEASWETDTVDEARSYIEKNLAEIQKPKYNLSASTIQKDGYEFDVTKFTFFSFSYIEITDYTDGRLIEKPEDGETETKINEEE
jgi:hypothetical protein